MVGKKDNCGTVGDVYSVEAGAENDESKSRPSSHQINKTWKSALKSQTWSQFHNNYHIYSIYFWLCLMIYEYRIMVMS